MEMAYSTHFDTYFQGPFARVWSLPHALPTARSSEVMCASFGYWTERLRVWN